MGTQHVHKHEHTLQKEIHTYLKGKHVHLIRERELHNFGWINNTTSKAQQQQQQKMPKDVLFGSITYIRRVRADYCDKRVECVVEFSPKP